MTYTAIPAHTRRFNRVVRAIAFIDLAMAMAIAIPFVSALFVEYLFGLDLLLGFETPAVALAPSFVFTLNVAGVMAGVWALCRLINQTPSLARLDTWRRFVVVPLILYYVFFRDQTPVLLLFVLTEVAAALVEGLAIRRFVRTTGG